MMVAITGDTDAGRVEEVKSIPSDSDATLKAKVLKVLERGNFSYPRAVSEEALAARAPIASSDEGRLKELAHEMARDDSEPVRYKKPNETFCLQVDTLRWAASRIRHHDPDQMEWPHKQMLNGNGK